MEPPVFIDDYKQVEKANRSTLRYYARAAALDALAWKGALTGRLTQGLSQARVQVLLLHHLFADQIAPFRKLLRVLAERHTFISYSEAAQRVLTGQIDKPYITFSVDDGFKNNVRLADILSEHGASACFFLCPSIVGESDVRKIRSFCTERLHFGLVEFLNWQDVELLLRHGHEIGSHTLNHRNLAGCSLPEAHNEIMQSRTDLQARCGAVRHFAWPYGRARHFNRAARRLVFEAGYESCASGERGAHQNRCPETEVSQLCLRRDHIIGCWNTKHVLYLLARNALRPFDQSFSY